MKKNKKYSALEKAIQFLHKRLYDKVWKDGDRLPTYRQLAQQAEVGAVTMWKAIAVLKKEKKLSYKERSGIFAGSKIPQKAASTPPQKTAHWSIVADQLKKDVLSGGFEGFNFLPLSKELCGRYGVHFLTLQKALKELVHEKIVIWEKRRYRIPQVNFSRTTNAICLILSNLVFELQLLKPTREIVDEFIRNMENECVKKNILLIKLRHENNLEKIPADFNIQGFVIWACPQLQGSIREIISSLKQYNKPIVVVDLLLEVGKDANTLLASLQKSKPPVFVCDTAADFRAGLTMGRFLLNKGYKKACFIAHSKPMYSYEDRYLGLKKAFEEFGIPKGLELVVLENLSEKETQEILCDNDRIYNANRKKENILLDDFKRLVEKEIRHPFSLRIAMNISDFRIACDCRSVYTPGFRQALAVPTAKVWIFTSDHAAIFGAFEFLKAEGLRVPQDIGLVGFDDFYESKIYNLTTWHFDYAGVARKAINLALFPEYAGRLLCNNGTNVFNVDGFVVDRGSV